MHKSLDYSKELRGIMLDKRPKAAVYSTLHSQRDTRAVMLLHTFCVLNGLRCIFYVDKKLPKEGLPSAWQRLLDDIAKGTYDVVITWLEAPGMADYCKQYDTQFEQVDPFVYSQSIRTSNVDIRRL